MNGNRLTSFVLTIFYFYRTARFHGLELCERGKHASIYLMPISVKVCLLSHLVYCRLLLAKTRVQPSQVFTLLETLYQSFDKIAKKRRVFKVGEHHSVTVCIFVTARMTQIPV